jgi:hypothetical protein
VSRSITTNQSGTGRWTLAECLPDDLAIFDGHGQIVGASKVAPDISGRKLAEAALLKSEKLAAPGRLAATLAHEINNRRKDRCTRSQIIPLVQPADHGCRDEDRGQRNWNFSAKTAHKSSSPSSPQRESNEPGFAFVFPKQYAHKN